jgi:diacylglycerol O-acyltransferase-1
MPGGESGATAKSGANASNATDAAAVAAARRGSESRRPAAALLASHDLHTECRVSLLSSDSDADFRGLYNLAGLTLAVMSARLIVENVLKYGLLIRAPWNMVSASQWDRIYPCLLCFCALFLLPLLSFAVETRAISGRLSTRAASFAHIAIAVVTLAVPVAVVHLTHANLLAGLALLISACCFFMKLVSFAHVSHELRTASSAAAPAAAASSTTGLSRAQSPSNGAARRRRRHSGDASADASANASATATGADASYDPKAKASAAPSLGHLYYFIAAPTLVYQQSYPLLPRRRLRFIARRFFELVLCVALMAFMVEQYILPTVQNAIKALDAHPQHSAALYLFVLERLFKLAVPNACVWMLMFFSFFHSWLNLTGELLRFGDRLFYKDWWNSESLDVYWRSWNLPVHNWLLRHVYAPTMRNVSSRLSPAKKHLVAVLITFVISALAHELLVSVPCHLFAFHAFLGMLGQVPLTILTRWIARTLKKPVWGNVIFWTTFLVFGQPALILLYYHDYLRGEQMAAALAAQ